MTVVQLAAARRYRPGPLHVDGWTFLEPGGGRPPQLLRGDLVDVLQRDGVELERMEAWGLDWRSTHNVTDVVAWRLAEPLTGMGGLIDG